MDWAGLMRAGFGGLGLSPAAFWAMTPRELAAALGARAAPGPISRADLDALRARYPDGRD